MAMPACRRCIRANVVCEGYEIRLTWGEKNVAETRRPIGFVEFPRYMLFHTHGELDEALERIEGAEPKQNTVVEGPFAMFNAKINEDRIHGSSTRMSSQIMHPSYPKWLDKVSEAELKPDFVLFCMSTLPSNYFDNCDQDHDNVLFEPDPSPSLPYFPIERHRQLLRLAPITQYLLSVYHEYMMPYMSFLVHPQNSWRTSQTPRAVNGIGDVLSTGRSSCTRLCILYSITASTAYFIRGRCSHNYDGVKFYQDLGDKLHKAAKCSIKGCLEGRHIGKYKDLLVALQCLQRTDYFVNYNHSLPWKFYDVIGLSIGGRLHRRPKVSAKASTLHRTSAMAMLLSKLAGALMLNSTNMDQNDEFYVDQSTYSWIDSIFSGMLPAKSSEAKKAVEARNIQTQSSNSFENPFEFEDYLTQYVVEEPYFLDDDGDQRNDSDLKGDSWELTYGIPCSLAFLFKEAVMISRGTRDSMGNLTPQGLQIGISDECMNFEAALENWYHQYTPPMILAPVEEESDAGRKGVCLALVNHHTLAFFEALVVYHYRVTRDVKRSILQPRVKRIIEHLDAINELTRTRNAPLVCPPCFAGFVGACEVIASDVALSNRYESWFQTLTDTSPFRYEDKMSVIRESRRRQIIGLPSCWWTVAQDHRVKLNFY